MLFRHLTARVFALMAFSAVPFILAVPAAAAPGNDVWNYDGGVFMDTSGSLPSGTCFRVKGLVTSGHFFDDFKRIDSKSTPTIFRSGNERVTKFPNQLLLNFTLYDIPCDSRLRPPEPRTYLTREVVSELRFALYWKRGLELRPVIGFKPLGFSVRPIFPYNSDAQDVPEKLEWFYQLTVPSADVPLTDSLVMIIRTPDHHLAARLAARL
jgi:hypothetical protein